MPNVGLSDPSVLLFIVLPVVLAGLLSAGVWRAWRRAGEPGARAARAAGMVGGAAAVWMALTWQLAASGALRQWDATPPALALLVLAILLIAFRLAFSRVGLRLAQGVPLWGLVAVQGFRLPLELAMHRMYERGIMPVQMSFSGWNFDIVTAVTAVIVAALLATGRAGPRLAAAWNVMGLLLLVNVVTIAILSTPLFRYFGDERLNVWVTYPPFVWLPAVLVLAALAGHLIIFRALRRYGRSPGGAEELVGRGQDGPAQPLG